MTVPSTPLASDVIFYCCKAYAKSVGAVSVITSQVEKYGILLLKSNKCPFNMVACGGFSPLNETLITS